MNPKITLAWIGFNLCALLSAGYFLHFFILFILGISKYPSTFSEGIFGYFIGTLGGGILFFFLARKLWKYLHSQKK